MRALVLTKAGGPEVLQLMEIPPPRIERPTDVLISVKAAGINPADWQNRKNGPPSYAAGTKAAGALSILGIDGVGVVAAVGPAISHIRVGDEVWYVDGGYAEHFGSYAEFKIVDGRYLSPKPQALSFVEAAALPTVALTSWEAVHDKGRVKPGDTVLVHGGAGGLGHVTIQMAKRLGARVATTVSGPVKAAMASRMGADLVIDYRQENVLDRLIAWAGQDGADVVFDYVGHANFAASFEQVAPYGTLVNTVFSPWPVGNNQSAEYRNIEIKFVNIGYPMVSGDHRLRLRQADILRQASELVDQGGLRPCIDRVVGIEGVGAAQAALEAGQVVGRVVLDLVEPRIPNQTL